MPRRNKNENEVFELDEAFREEGESSSSGNGVGEFPEPQGFDLGSDEQAPLWRGSSRDSDSDDEEEDDAFASDAEEFLGGSADTFVDDNQTDYYEYGDKMHNVRADIPAPVVTTSGRGRHGKPATSVDHMDVHQQRSRRMRWLLRIVILLLLVLLAALGYFGYRLYQESNSLASQPDALAVQDVSQAAESDIDTHDSVASEAATTTVPDLVSLMGKSDDEAASTLGRGATVTVETPVDDEDDPVKLKQTVVLTEEPSDTKSGTPTVYLGMDAAGKVVMTGYSAPTTSLGYGSVSFADAVSSKHIVEATLREAGLDVADGTVKLPDSKEYSTYSDDGKTLVKEQCTFEGTATAGGSEYEWSSVLLYNYTASNASGNLADTVRNIFIYIDKK